MSSVNLMSLHARRRECIRARVRQWCLTLGTICGLLALISLERYMTYRKTTELQFRLESKYDPIAELKTANQMLAKQIAAIRGEEQFVLALSEQEPTIPLLGILGQAIADVDHRVFLQKAELVNQGLESGLAVEKKALLNLSGIANSGSAVNQLAETIREAVNSGNVEITSTKEYQVKQQPMHDFTMKMNF